MRIPRAILVTLALLGCGNVAFAAGVFAGVVGNLSLYEATGAGAATFAASLMATLAIMAFVAKDSQAG